MYKRQDMSTAEATDSSNIVIGKDTVIKGDISTAGVVGKTWSGLTNCVSSVSYTHLRKFFKLADRRL